MTRIRDLDVEVVIDLIERATDRVAGTSRDAILNGELKRTPMANRVALLRAAIVNAALGCARSADELVIEWPLMRALVRAHRHPRAPKVFFERELRGVNVAPIFERLVIDHPELAWSADDVKDDLIDAVIGAGGDHEVELQRQPWMTHWGPAIYPMTALWTFVTLRKLGDLDFDEWEKGVYEETIEHSECMKNLKPSRLVKPPPPKKPT